jgi:hypothetical protein
MDHNASRRDLLLTSFMAALPLGMASAAASPLNPEQTIIKPPDGLQWQTLPPFPPGSVDNVALAGQTTAPGLYYTLVRLHPGYMSAPHFYSTDRYCMVGNLVVQQRRRFRPRCLRAGPRRQLCAARRADAALRRRDQEPQRAGRDRDLRHRTGQLHAHRSLEAAVAGSVTARGQAGRCSGPNDAGRSSARVNVARMPSGPAI